MNEMLSKDEKIYILTFLYPKDLYQIFTLSKEWYEISHSNIIWKNLSEFYKFPSQPAPSTTWKDFFKYNMDVVYWPSNVDHKYLSVQERCTCVINTCEEEKTFTIISPNPIKIEEEYYCEIHIDDFVPHFVDPVNYTWLVIGMIGSKKSVKPNIKFGEFDWIGNRKGEYSLSSSAQIYNNGVPMALRLESLKFKEGSTIISMWVVNGMLIFFKDGKEVIWYSVKEDGYYFVFPGITFFRKSRISSAKPYKYETQILKRRNEIFKKIGTLKKRNKRVLY